MATGEVCTCTLDLYTAVRCAQPEPGTVTVSTFLSRQTHAARWQASLLSTVVCVLMCRHPIAGRRPVMSSMNETAAAYWYWQSSVITAVRITALCVLYPMSATCILVLMLRFGSIVITVHNTRIVVLTVTGVRVLCGGNEILNER